MSIVSPPLTAPPEAVDDVAFWHAAFFEQAKEFHLVVDTEGHFLLTNSAWETALGYTSAALAGILYQDLVHPDDEERTYGPLVMLVEGSPVNSFTNRIRAADGEYRWVEWSAHPVLDRGVVMAVGRDVTRYVESQEQLRLARDEARKASHAKSTFLSRMSHELRTPLNSVIGFSQLLGMDDLTEEQREYVGFIERSGGHLLELINEVLDIARIEEGRLRLSLEPVCVADELQTALDLIRPQAADRGITIPSSVPASGLYATADRQRLLQVLLNLLSNAVKYNQPEGSISITCESSGGTLSIAITDTGIGMNDAQLTQLFTPFERLGAENSPVEGTGVGMALSKALTHHMGGTLTVSSAVGVGSTFCVELPAADSPQHDEPILDGHSDQEAELRVLYIEDNVANTMLMERALRTRGCIELTTAIQGSLGLDLAMQTQPDLILLDLHLPDIPGEEVLRRLRANAETAHSRIVVCSADASPNQVARLQTLGADGYLTKPIHLPDLFELLDQVQAAVQAPTAFTHAWPKELS